MRHASNQIVCPEKPAALERASAHTRLRRPGGQGASRVRFAAPRATACAGAPEAQVLPERAAPPPRPADRPHILHIDHDDASAALVAALLLADAHVTRVSTLADARHALTNDVYSLIIVNPALPDGSVAQLLRAVSSTPFLLHAQEVPADARGVHVVARDAGHRALWLAVAALLKLPAMLTAQD
jgi:hypothetical protein